MIPKVVGGVLEEFPAGDVDTLDDVLRADALARVQAEGVIGRLL